METRRVRSNRFNRLILSYYCLVGCSAFTIIHRPGYRWQRKITRSTVNDDDDHNIGDYADLSTQLNDMFKINTRKTPETADPAAGHTAYDIYDYFTRRDELRNRTSSLPKLDELDTDLLNETEADGIYLDPDIYARSRDILNADGSLNLPDNSNQEYRKVLENIAQPPPNSPDVSLSQDVTMDDLWSAIQQRPHANATSQQIHEQVFATEQGYLNQSKLFREALTDPRKQSNANRYRRGQAFRKRQEAAIERLDEGLDKFLQEYMSTDSNYRHCKKCGCRLGVDDRDDDICTICHAQAYITPKESPTVPPRSRTNRSTPNLSTFVPSRVHRPPSFPVEPAPAVESTTTPESDPWHRLVDPDTGEVFYWNEDTEEMKW